VTTTAYPGPGFLLQCGAGGTGTAMTTIPGIQDMRVIPETTDVHDITNQSSTGGYEEVIPTILRTGETSFPLIFDPNNATHDDKTGLQYIRNHKVLTAFQLLLPTPNVGSASPYSKLLFSGYVTGFEITAPVNGVLGADTRIKVTGQPAWA
jgi:hypothetical protein